MKTLPYIAILLGFALSLLGCASSNPMPLNQSEQYYNYIQPTFSDYLTETHSWLVKNRGYMSDEHDQEIAMNMPFELKPDTVTNKAILLVHGLGDSPYSFSDVAQTLRQQGFYVQTLLLPGHGSKPSDLNLPHYQDWQHIVDHYANLLKNDYQQVWLGGFSTGGNLVTIHSVEQGEIDGLILFSPGFQSRAPIMEKFAPLASIFIDGYDAEENNKARYTSAPINGAIAYTESAVQLRKSLKKHTVAIPTLIAVAEADSIIDPEEVKELFDQRFTNPNNQLLWYGETQFDSSSVQSNTMKLDNLHISTASHMSPLFAPSNPYYGQNGEHRMCMNSMSQKATDYCEQGGEVWWSAWGYEEEGKVHARLTWNPYYQQLTDSMSNITAIHYVAEN
ncbi:alpha/beta hydrolase [Vibrio sp. LaRot3]|uniref:alpha/beta hydrolase n=1 Tax=Vibrio sp. LaRot3 TaxID=2998829 RepID=UPI0022CE3009|nr:alpha/beta fold hydrolase [Vibrio sp. LaRot3]MDA0149642.1 alpha/beta fold hydrolase [Vibrio sp. LaRot3]